MSLRRSAYPPGSKPMSPIRSHPPRNAVLSVGRLRRPASAGALDRTTCAITLMGENRTDRHLEERPPVDKAVTQRGGRVLLSLRGGQW